MIPKLQWTQVPKNVPRLSLWHWSFCQWYQSSWSMPKNVLMSLPHFLDITNSGREKMKPGWQFRKGRILKKHQQTINSNQYFRLSYLCPNWTLFHKKSHAVRIQSYDMQFADQVRRDIHIQQSVIHLLPIGCCIASETLNTQLPNVQTRSESVSALVI